MRIKKVLYGITVLPVILILTIVEWLLKVLVKMGTVVAGLLINVFVVCILVAIFTRYWLSVEILGICIVFGLIIVYGAATILNLIIETREHIKMDLKI